MLREIEYSTSKIEEEIARVYPHMILDTSRDISGNNGMVDYERRFLQFLLERELVIFREPSFEGMDFNPDFFVWNPKAQRGKIVEITFISEQEGFMHVSRKTRARKKRQLVSLENCGVPFVILYREHLKNISKYSYPNLFSS